MRFLIIGLGVFGDNLARDLSDLGHEVIGADRDNTHVEAIKDYISTVYHIDSTDESSLSVLPLTNVDIVVVAIGENFGASIRTVALLKKAGVKHIYARAIDSIHEAILQGFHIDRILYPEQRAAIDLTRELEFGAGTTSMPIDSDRLVVSMAAPDIFIGLSYAEIRHDKSYKVELIAAGRPAEETNFVGMNYRAVEPVDLEDDASICSKGDIITVFGTKKTISRLADR